MLFRALVSGALASALVASTAFAGNLDAAGTEDAAVLVPVAPAGSLGGVSPVVLAAGGLLLAGGIIAALNDDDDDDDGPSGTVTNAQ